MKVPKFFVPIVIVLGIAAFQSIFIVQEINQAIVLQFGDPKKIILELDDQPVGLHQNLAFGHINFVAKISNL